MSVYDGVCHCGQVKWTVSFEEDQKNHIVWYAACLRPQIYRSDSPAIATPARHSVVARRL